MTVGDETMTVGSQTIINGAQSNESCCLTIKGCYETITVGGATMTVVTQTIIIFCSTIGIFGVKIQNPISKTIVRRIKNPTIKKEEPKSTKTIKYLTDTKRKFDSEKAHQITKRLTQFLKRGFDSNTN